MSVSHDSEASSVCCLEFMSLSCNGLIAHCNPVFGAVLSNQREPTPDRENESPVSFLDVFSHKKSSDFFEGYNLVTLTISPITAIIILR